MCALFAKEYLLKTIKCFCTDLNFERNESFPGLHIKVCLTLLYETSALYKVLHQSEPHAVCVLLHIVQYV